MPTVWPKNCVPLVVGNLLLVGSYDYDKLKYFVSLTREHNSMQNLGADGVKNILDGE